MAWAACTFGNSPSVLKDMSRFYSNICSCADEVYFRESLAYFSRIMPNHVLQLLQQHGFVLNRSACCPDLSPTDNIWRVMKGKNTTEKTQDRWAAGILYQTGIGQHYSTKTPATLLLPCRIAGQTTSYYWSCQGRGCARVCDLYIGSTRTVKKIPEAKFIQQKYTS